MSITLRLEDRSITVNGTRFEFAPHINELTATLGTNFVVRPNPDERAYKADWYVWNESVVAWVVRESEVVRNIVCYLQDEADNVVRFSGFDGELWITGVRCIPGILTSDLVRQKLGLPFVDKGGWVSGRDSKEENAIYLYGSPEITGVVYSFNRRNPKASGQ